VIADLVATTGKKYRDVMATRRLIAARWKEGYHIEAFKAVHRNMSAAWMNDPDMEIYLRPATLYCASKFEGYLNRSIAHADPIVYRAKDELLSLLKNQSNRTMPGDIKEGAKKLFFSLGIPWHEQQKRVSSGIDIFIQAKEHDAKMAAAGEK